MEDELKKIHEHYQENYYSEEIDGRIKDGVQQKIRNNDSYPKEKQRHTLAKRISYITATCVVLLGIFIGSTFVSPAMAEVASKIPFLNKIFEQKPIADTLMNDLINKGYQISGAGYSVREKTYFVQVKGTEDYYDRVKDELEELVETIISSRGYDGFKVEVEKEQVTDYTDEHESEPRKEASMFLLEELNELIPELQKQGYKIHQYGLGYPSPESEDIRIDLDIEDTEKRTDEIEKVILESVNKQDLVNEVTVKFHPFNVTNREIERKWTADILPIIWEGMLNKKEYKTKGVGYSFKDGTMHIYITTTIKKSDSKAPDLANKIESAIQTFLQSEELKGVVGDTPYKIVVRDKDSNEIN